ncbi:MAG: sugar phosphate isomerase/epimerase family protein [Candidatus Sumerlaeaceae bacterium]
MKLGLLINFTEGDLAMLERLAFQSCELICFPDHPLSPTIGATPDDWKRARERLDAIGVEVSAIGSYTNNLTPDKSTRERSLRHLEQLFDFAPLMGCNIIGTFAGRDPDKAPADNIPEFRKVFVPLIAKAEERGLKVVIEHCPMFTDSFLRGTNFAYTPELWDMMFEAVPSEALGLEYDPSHLIGQGIDYLHVIRQYGRRIYHCHAKDAELMPETVQRCGWQDPRISRHRMPGLGQVDWARVIETLHDIGYSSNLDIEGRHDPVYRGNEEEKGLEIAVKHLTPLLS